MSMKEAQVPSPEEIAAALQKRTGTSERAAAEKRAEEELITTEHAKVAALALEIRAYQEEIDGLVAHGEGKLDAEDLKQLQDLRAGFAESRSKQEALMREMADMRVEATAEAGIEASSGPSATEKGMGPTERVAGVEVPATEGVVMSPLESVIEVNGSVQKSSDALTKELDIAKDELTRTEKRYKELSDIDKPSAQQRSEERDLKKALPGLRANVAGLQGKLDDSKKGLPSSSSTVARRAAAESVTSAEVTPPPEPTHFEATAAIREGQQDSPKVRAEHSVTEKPERPPMGYTEVWEILSDVNASPDALSKAADVYLRYHLPSREKIDTELERRARSKGSKSETVAAKDERVADKMARKGYFRMNAGSYVNKGGFDEDSVGPQGTLASNVRWMTDAYRIKSLPKELIPVSQALTAEQLGVIQDLLSDTVTQKMLVDEIERDAAGELGVGQTLGAKNYNTLMDTLDAVDLALATGDRGMAQNLFNKANEFNERMKQMIAERRISDTNGRMDPFLRSQASTLEKFKKKLDGTRPTS